MEYDQCTNAGTPGKTWCATEGYTEEAGHPWGWCNANCEVDAGTCCTAQTAQCLACSAGVTVAAYCVANPGTAHCSIEIDASAGCSAEPAPLVAGGSTELRLGGMLHTLTVPAGYKHGTPTKALLFFHGWGGDHSECGAYCSASAASAGFVTVALSGHNAAWANAGSANAVLPSCAPSTSCDLCPADCTAQQCSGSNGCWWSTCKDSIAQVVEVLNWLEANLCVHLHPPPHTPLTLMLI